MPRLKKCVHFVCMYDGSVHLAGAMQLIAFRVLNARNLHLFSYILFYVNLRVKKRSVILLFGNLFMQPL